MNRPTRGGFLLFRRRLLVVVAAVLSCGPRSAAADPAVYETNLDPGVGFNLISWWSGTTASHWTSAINSLYDYGFREVSISPVRRVTEGTGVISQGSYPSLSGIAAGVARAKELGMRVTLNPFVEPSGGGWRGYYNPSGAEATRFWSDYRSYMLEVANVAQTYGVDAMNVGTELRAIVRNSANNDDWDNVITAVDAVYSGQLGYAANWDNYNNGNLTAAIWEHPGIDYIGIDSYFNNTLIEYMQDPGESWWTARSQALAACDASGSYPDADFIDLVTAAWNKKLDTQILPFADARKSGAGMPVVFTEFGHLAYNQTAVEPQNSSGQPVDTAEQVMAFEGLISALDGRLAEMPAVDIWQWEMTGSSGSLWNINPGSSPNQPNNSDLADWLVDYISTATIGGPELPGDYNGDSSVDAADYTVWRDTFGQYVDRYAGADGDGSGQIDNGDYQVWKDNFGAVGSDALAGGAAAEPRASLIALVALCCLAPWRRGS